ncbi:MAG: hypothetical protein JNK72_19665 [Myxococcales bacterium]|nr:hypothetical protein [Myxococcales bacterium]
MSPRSVAPSLSPLASAPSGCFTLSFTRDPVTVAESLLGLQTKGSAKEAELPASRFQPVRAQQRWVNAHGLQSRAPTLCSNPSDPGCRCEQPDAPHSHGDLYSLADPFWVGHLPADIAPPLETLVTYGVSPRGAPREGVRGSLLRPPSC